MLRAVEIFLKKKEIVPLLLLCVIPCWIMIGCVHDKWDDEAEDEEEVKAAKEEERIATYKTLLQEYKKHIVPGEEQASFDVEEKTYKELEKEYRRFALTQHPDKGGDEEKFKAGKEAWEKLKEKLQEDG
jgi:hypothetical protein